MSYDSGLPKQKTAMQELIDYVVWISNNPQIEDPLLNILAFADLQLKAKERQQIIDAFCSTNTSKGIKTFSSILKDEGEQYYNETYGHE